MEEEGEALSWGEIWSHVILATGWTVPEIEACPWPDFAILLKYMKKNPPLYKMFRWANFEEEEKGHRPTEDELAQAIVGM